MRILCLGIGDSTSTEYATYNPNEYAPTIFDYDLVILNMSYLVTNTSYIPVFSKRKDEFEKFFESGGICFVIAREEIIREDEGTSFSSYDWCPFRSALGIANYSGLSVMCTSKNAKRLFDEVKFSWKCYFKSYPDKCKILARNRANDPISLVFPYKKGCCVFLPYPPEEAEIVNALVEIGLRLAQTEEEKEKETLVQIPDWAKEYATQSELDLLSKRKEIDNKLGKFTKFKRLLWETGESLQELVIGAFKEFEIEVEELPKGSHADFEFVITGELTGVCEVKGLTGNADRRSMRQLLDYFIEQRDIEGRNVKGVFMINHFLDIMPETRGEPATEDALELAEKHSFVIVNTVDLYDNLVKLWEGKVTNEDFLKRFLD